MEKASAHPERPRARVPSTASRNKSCARAASANVASRVHQRRCCGPHRCLPPTGTASIRTARGYTSAAHSARPCTRPDCSSYPDRFRRFVPYPRSDLRQLFGDVRNQITDVGAAIQQLVEPPHDFLPRRSVAFERGIPFVRGGLQLTIHLAQLFLKAFLRRFEPRFERCQIFSRGLCSPQFIELFV